MAAEGRFYVEGGSVYRRPVENDIDQTPYFVCDCSPEAMFLDEETANTNAEEVARTLNRLPEAEALLIHTAQSIRAGADPQPLADALEEWAVG